MRIVSYFFLYLFISGLAGCSSSSSVSKSTKKDYSEDLSSYRVDYNGTEKEKKAMSPENASAVKPTHHITSKLDNTLEQIAYNNKEYNTTSGYTILVYSGSSREAAANAKDMVYKILPDSRPQIQYIQPYYKVKVGKFLERLEAQKSYSDLREEFPDAMIIPEKIEIQ